jgi:hypothetical protein
MINNRKIRGNSLPADRARFFWKPIAAADRGRLLYAAERYERQTRSVRHGRRNGALGFVALEVLRELTRLVDFKTGRLDPSYDTLAKRCCRSRAAVATALQRLRRAGFLDWVRRYAPTDAAGQAGPQLVQISNAYRLMMPAALRRLLGYLATGGPGDDVGAAQIAAAQAVCNQQAFDLSYANGRFDTSGNSLAASLNRLRLLVLQRESAPQAETPKDII